MCRQVACKGKRVDRCCEWLTLKMVPKASSSERLNTEFQQMHWLPERRRRREFQTQSNMHFVWSIFCLLQKPFAITDSISFPRVSQNASSLRAVTSSWTRRFLTALWGAPWLCLLLVSCPPARPSLLKPRAECLPSSCTQSSWKSWPPSPRSTALHWTVLLRSNGSVLMQTTSLHALVSKPLLKMYEGSYLEATSRWLRPSESPESTKYAHILHIEL